MCSSLATNYIAKTRIAGQKKNLTAELSASQVFLPVRAVSIVDESFLDTLISLYNSAILCAILCVCIGILRPLCAILCVCIGTLGI